MTMLNRKESLVFEINGHLEPGIHDCTMDELQALTFTNSHRRALGAKLLNFLDWPTGLQGFAHIYIGGGFLSNRPVPSDVDLVLETKGRFGSEAFAAVEPFFRVGLDHIFEQYSIHLHFWMEGAPAPLLDYRTFFQQSNPEDPRDFDIDRKGIVRLSPCAERQRRREPERYGELSRDPDAAYAALGSLAGAHIGEE
jgi:hypothetical protein